MRNDYDINDIELLIAQARQARSDAAGELIANGTHRALHWLAAVLDRALHAFLMSPTAPRG